MATNLRDYLNAKRGRANDLARKLDVSPMTVGDWKLGKRPVPLARCTQIEKATAGMVTRKTLKPDSWRLHWPELVKSRKQLEEHGHVSDEDKN